MKYFVARQSPKYHQMTLEEFLFGKDTQRFVVSYNESNTRTYATENDFSLKIRQQARTKTLINYLEEFNKTFAGLREADRRSLYHSFKIPKKKGGYRQIDAPNEALKSALYSLKALFETQFGCLYHTSAFAYVKGRSTVDAVKRHQANESKWFAKYDLSNFFGSTTPEFVFNMLSMIFPFTEVVKDEHGAEELKKALDLAFLNGGLPQGTPLSPMLTNVMMIPIDFAISNALRDFHNNKFVYTRYADDFQISSRYDFSCKEVENLIKTTLASFNAPFTINGSKTRYGSSAGRNWNLGVMLNKDNEITVGHEKKRRFKAMLTNYAMDKMHGKEWSLDKIRKLDGIRSYYVMIEGEKIEAIIKKLSEKFRFDIYGAIRNDLS